MNCNDCGGFLPHGCECSPFGGRRSRNYEAPPTGTEELARRVRSGETLQWKGPGGEWLTPRDRETMLRILREDPTRTYRIVSDPGVAIPQTPKESDRG